MEIKMISRMAWRWDDSNKHKTLFCTLSRVLKTLTGTQGWFKVCECFNLHRPQSSHLWIKSSNALHCQGHKYLLSTCSVPGHNGDYDVLVSSRHWAYTREREKLYQQFSTISGQGHTNMQLQLLWVLRRKRTQLVGSQEGLSEEAMFKLT